MSERSSRPFWLGEDQRGWDHVRLHVQLIRDPRIGAAEMAVYAGIAVHAEANTGEARPSKDTLAEYAQISVRAVYDATQVLKKTGYIQIEHRHGKASIYRLMPPPVIHIVSTPAGGAEVHHIGAGQRHPETDTPAGGAEVGVSTPAGGATPPRQEVPDTPAGGADELEPRTRTNELEETDTSTHVDAAFERFWESYPKRNGKRVGKSKAHSAWKRLNNSDRQAATVGVGHYRAACDGGITIAKDAFRWLRDKAFEDWLTPATPLRRVSAGRSFQNVGDKADWS